MITSRHVYLSIHTAFFGLHHTILVVYLFRYFDVYFSHISSECYIDNMSSPPTCNLTLTGRDTSHVNNHLSLSISTDSRDIDVDVDLMIFCFCCVNRES